MYHWVNVKGRTFGVGTYPMTWVERYQEKNYLTIDPVITGCFQRFHPVNWKELDWSSKAARQFMEDAVLYGVGNQGLSIPIRGPRGQYALFTMSHTCEDDEWEHFIDYTRRDVILMAHLFNKKTLELETDPTAEVNQTLSPREAETLTMLALGYSRAQTAHTLGISEYTLRVYAESARFKLGALNTTHAVASAVSRGLIVTPLTVMSAHADQSLT